KAPLVEIIPGKGSGQLRKRELRFLDQKEIKALFPRPSSSKHSSSPRASNPACPQPPCKSIADKPLVVCSVSLKRVRHLPPLEARRGPELTPRTGLRII